MLDRGRNGIQQCLAVGEVAVCRVRRNTNAPSRFSNSQRIRSTSSSELKARVDQRRAQIAVVVSGLRVRQPLTLLGTEVYGVNITMLTP